jgi:hypothetical protein
MRRNDRTRRRRSGVVVIDVILGLTLLLIAGIAWITLMGQTFHSVQLVRDRERELRRAGGLLDAIAGSWGSTDFDARLGTIRIRGFELTTRALAPRLYQVTVADPTNRVPLLRTVFYASDTANANR